jgi:hypothetical protein
MAARHLIVDYPNLLRAGESTGRFFSSPRDIDPIGTLRVIGGRENGIATATVCMRALDAQSDNEQKRWSDVGWTVLVGAAPNKDIDPLIQFLIPDLSRRDPRVAIVLLTGDGDASYAVSAALAEGAHITVISMPGTRAGTSWDNVVYEFGGTGRFATQIITKEMLADIKIPRVAGAVDAHIINAINPLNRKTDTTTKASYSDVAAAVNSNTYTTVSRNRLSPRAACVLVVILQRTILSEDARIWIDRLRAVAPHGAESRPCHKRVFVDGGRSLGTFEIELARGTPEANVAAAVDALRGIRGVKEVRRLDEHIKAWEQDARDGYVPRCKSGDACPRKSDGRCAWAH